MGRSEHDCLAPDDRLADNLLHEGQGDDKNDEESYRTSWAQASQLIGVTYDHRTRAFRSEVGLKDKRYLLGSFDTARDAALAYDWAVRNLRVGRRLNFLDDLPIAAPPQTAGVSAVLTIADKYVRRLQPAAKAASVDAAAGAGDGRAAKRKAGSPPPAAAGAKRDKAHEPEKAPLGSSRAALLSMLRLTLRTRSIREDDLGLAELSEGALGAIAADVRGVQQPPLGGGAAGGAALSLPELRARLLVNLRAKAIDEDGLHVDQLPGGEIQGMLSDVFSLAAPC